MKKKVKLKTKKKKKTIQKKTKKIENNEQNNNNNSYIIDLENQIKIQKIGKFRKSKWCQERKGRNRC